MSATRPYGFGRQAIAAIALAFTILAPAANAKTFTVTRHGDPAPGACKGHDCSLREAIRAANMRAGKDTILLPSRRRAYDLTRTNAGTVNGENESLRGDLDVTGSTKLIHEGKGLATIDANRHDRVLEVRAGGSARVVRVRLTGGGNVSDDFSPVEPGDGAGVLASGPITLFRSLVAGNRGASAAGGIQANAPTAVIRSRVVHNRNIDSLGGGIEAYDTSLRIVRSHVDQNTAGNAGGGIVAESGATLTMSKSTASRNVAAEGGAGAYLPGAERARITGSTIAGNIGHGSVGGIENSGTNLTVVNSTIAGNRTDFSGGGIAQDPSGGQTTLRSVTVARNLSDADGMGNDGPGAGIYVEGGTFNVTNSVIAKNRAGTAVDNCDGAFTSGGGNVLGLVPGGCSGFGGSDLTGQNPRLGKLAGNGGPTPTLALHAGSPAIGHAIKSSSPKRDQRGHKRDKHPDSGAYER